MDKKGLLELVNFFNRLEVEEEDITTEEQRTDGQLEVIATYKFEGKTYKTKSLYYKNANFQKNAAHLDYLSFFEEDAFWLDIGKNQWPEGRGGNIEAKAIPDMTDDEDFKKFLLTLVNNNKTGFIQKITKGGRSQQYGDNLENNNHWHDLVKLIKEGIRNKGCNIDKKYFSRLVFEWNGGNRVSLHSMYGSRKIIQDFYKNIKSIQENMKLQDITDLLKYKKQIILQGPPGTGKTFTAKQIAQEMVADMENDCVLIQFHPAYTYEDFVRGIVVESAEGSNTPTYTTKNKVLAEMAQKALENQKGKPVQSKSDKLNELFDSFVESIREKIDKGETVRITDFVHISRIDSKLEAFRYKGENWKSNFESIVRFSHIKSICENQAFERSKVKKLTDFLPKYAIEDATYFNNIALLFKEFAESKDFDFGSIKSIPIVEDKKYVLIIDEINRANLPAVLGELIYALEYRNEPVESMYDIDGNREITLPDNLYIIGTMNTADRSVGHIDYAIRRRFAFVDILPSSDVIDSVISDNDLKEKAKNLFEDVAALFTSDYLASDFEAKDVQLGHSYFLAKSEDELKMKLEFEIKPILNEYVKDGILNNQAKGKIEVLCLR